METEQLLELLVARMQDLDSHLRRTLAKGVTRRLPIEDILQETFRKAAASLDDHDYRGDKAFFSWMKSISKNLVLSHIRKHSREAEHGSGIRDVVNQLLDSGVLTPSDIVSASENRQILAICIGRLPSHHQEVIQLRYENGKTFLEIAEAVGRTEGQVRGLHRNAISKLRSHFRKLAELKSDAAK